VVAILLSDGQVCLADAGSLTCIVAGWLRGAAAQHIQVTANAAATHLLVYLCSLRGFCAVAHFDELSQQ